MKYLHLFFLLLFISCCTKAQHSKRSINFKAVLEKRIELNDSTKSRLTDGDVKILVKGLKVKSNLEASVRVFVDLDNAGSGSSLDLPNYVASITINPSDKPADFALQLNSKSVGLLNSINRKGYLLVSLIAMPLFEGGRQPVISVQNVQLYLP